MSELKFFVDRAGALGKLERTPQGGYRAPAKIARVGILLYSARELRNQGLDVPVTFKDADIVRVYNPPEVLEAALDTLRDAPVTNGHPPKMVSPENYSKVTSGTVSASSVAFDGEYIQSQLAIQDATLLADVELGKREVSAGYGAITAFESGTGVGGEAYDAVRKVIVYNHVAVVPRGRAGSKVCIALDSMEIPTDEVIVALKIKGVEVAPEKAQEAVDALDAELQVAKAEIEKLKGAQDALQSKLTEATSDAAIDAAVKARLEKQEAEKKRTEKLKAVKDAFPGLELEGRSEVYIDGLYDGLSKLATDPNAALRGATGAAPAPAPSKPKLSARERMLRRNRGEKVD